MTADKPMVLSDVFRDEPELLAALFIAMLVRGGGTLDMPRAELDALNAVDLTRFSMCVTDADNLKVRSI